MMGYANCVSEFVFELLSDLRREVMNSFIDCFHAAPRRLRCGPSDGKFYGQAERAISNGKLHTLLRFHIRPINVVVFHGPSGRSYLGEGFALICIQRLSRPNFATQRCPWRNNWITRDSFTSVLSY